MSLAVVSNSLPPYRAHLHKRIAREIPEIRLWSLFTHDAGDGLWSGPVPEEVGPIHFGAGEHPAAQTRVGAFLSEWRKGGRIIRWVKRQGVRALIVSGYNSIARWRLIAWCRRRGVPCFLTGDSNIRGDLARGFKARVKHALLRRIVARCTGVLPFGSLGEAFFAKYGAEAARMFRFPLEPDYALIEGLSPQAVRGAADQYGLAPGRRRIIYSGRLAAGKRVDLLIDAFAALAARRPRWDLVIVGAGPQRDALAARLPPDLKGRVTWTGFVNDPAVVAALYRSSDLLVLPSDYEPWALVINEAAAAGLAIACTSVVGAAAELVREGVNGRTFEPGRLDQLVECLSEMTAGDGGDAMKVDAMKAASATVLADWRRDADPVAGLRKALRWCGVLPPEVQGNLR